MGVALCIGIVVGAALGVVLYALTGNAVWFSMSGVGVALGLMFGVVFENGKKAKASEGGLPPKDV